MDRQAHDYAAASAMAYAQQQRQAANAQQQQQQQFGFHPQHQQFPPSVHGPPFLPPHPSLQQYPYHPHMQQQPQLHPHAHLLHLQQQQQAPPAFPPHGPPHIVPSAFHGPFDSAPPPAAPPSDPELHKRIDKLVEYSAKNGPEFEAMIREKQQDNPAYGFLFGGEGHGYYRYMLWVSTRSSGTPFNPPFPPSSVPVMHPSQSPMMNSSPLNAPPMNSAAPGTSASLLGAPQMHQSHYHPFYDQQQIHQHTQPFIGHGRPEYDQSSKSFKGLSGPLPSDVAMELNNVLTSLSGTKESIKSAKMWFMQRSPFAPALAEAFRERVFALDDSERQMHIIYLANDILFDSLQRRINPHELDNEALAFKPVLGSMLARIYHNPQDKEQNQSRLQKILHFWASKEVYDQDTIYALEGEMVGGMPSQELSAAGGAGGSQVATSHNVSQWQPDKQSTVPSLPDQLHPDKQLLPGSAMPPSLANQQFLSTSIPPNVYGGSMPINPPLQPTPPHLMAAPTPNIGEKLPPYPLFPPGLIPGMVKKMQIGSGVPYSPLSPLDIPTVIPPSNIPPSDILERVSKFFKEIGEVNPSEGQISSGAKDEDDDYERVSPVRKGGACIPPPPNLQQVDPETGTYPDGSVERKPGSSSSGRLGLGATANPNEVSQYDDVYTSYRKHRSTNYHTSLSARSTVTR